MLLVVWSGELKPPHYNNFMVIESSVGCSYRLIPISTAEFSRRFQVVPAPLQKKKANNHDQRLSPNSSR